MTVYVDNMNLQAQVGRINAKWFHLTADMQDELHEFAQRIGLKRAWFQTCKPGKPLSCKPDQCVHWHYDVTATKRREAIAAGAKEITFREMGALIRARRRSA